MTITESTSLESKTRWAAMARLLARSSLRKQRFTPYTIPDRTVFASLFHPTLPPVAVLQGWLIGTENRGLNHMFTFINTSRLGTAVQVTSDSMNKTS